MRIHLRYAPALDLGGLANNGEAELSSPCSIGQLLERHGVPAEQRRYVIPILNGQRKPLDTLLRQGDSLRLLLPLGGG